MPNPLGPTLEPRNPKLDQLRGLAIGAVVLSHLALVFREDSEFARLLNVPAFGVGVDLFFVISGFFVVGRAARSVAKAKSFWRGASAFWLGRLIRIGGPTWTTIGLLFIVACVAGGDTLYGGDLAAAAGFVANFHWAPCFAGQGGCGDPLISSHFWSLAVEMQFYALAPFLAALGRRALRLLVLTALAVGAIMTRPWGGYWWTFRPDALLVGVLLGIETRWRAPSLKRIPTIGIWLSTYWLLVAALLARVLSFTGGVGLVVIAAIFGLVVAGNRDDAHDQGSRGGKAFRWIGEKSFSIYLVHLPILTATRDVLHAGAPAGAVMIIAVLAAFSAALCLEALVTRPSSILARRAAASLCDRASSTMRPRAEDSKG